LSYYSGLDDFKIRTLDNRAKGDIKGYSLVKIGENNFNTLKRNSNPLNNGMLDLDKYYAVATEEFTLQYSKPNVLV